jgi:hypothetical protein
MKGASDSGTLGFFALLAGNNSNMAEPKRNQSISRGWRILLGSIPIVGICLIGVYYLLKELQTYLIWAKPAPASIIFDGRPVALDADSQDSFIMNEIWGKHIIVVRFKDGSTMRVAVFPRLSDDNSSSLEITPKKVNSYGDLRFKVLQP